MTVIFCLAVCFFKYNKTNKVTTNSENITFRTKMFQSDDFDDILDENLSIIESDIICMNAKALTPAVVEKKANVLIEKLNGQFLSSPINQPLPCPANSMTNAFHQPATEIETPSRIKRKRKFPGPAGLLPDSSRERELENQGDKIQSSQNYTCSQNQLPTTVFEEGPWLAMKNDTKFNPAHSRFLSQYTIAYVKAQALAHQLEGRKVPLLTGVVQSIDRTLQDPLIILRDKTGEIQCTLHRDAWEQLGPYLAPQYSVMLLKNTSVFTTGTASKKIILNITNNNILSLYSDEENQYTKNGSTLRISCEGVLAKIFSMETISLGSETITVLRNSSISPQMESTHAGSASLKSLKEQNNPDETLDDDIIAQTLLEGINTEFLDDFEL